MNTGDEVAKRAAGAAAARLVNDGDRVGLGTGSTARWFIEALGERVRDGLRVSAVASSDASAALARDCGIALLALDAGGLDIAVDGADLVDPELRLIKGGGGAMVREKIVARAARRFVVIVDAGKLTDRLHGRVPVEVLGFGIEHTLRMLGETGGRYEVRRDSGGFARTDNGNLIADGVYESIEDAEGLAGWLDAVPGVVGHGLFIGMTPLVLVGDLDGAVHEIRGRDALRVD